MNVCSLSVSGSLALSQACLALHIGAMWCANNEI